MVVVDCACVDEAGAADLVDREKLVKELVVVGEAVVLGMPKLGKELAVPEEAAALVGAVEKGVVEAEVEKEGNAGVEAADVAAWDEVETGVKILVVVMVENNGAVGAPNPNDDAGFVAGVLKTVAADVAVILLEAAFPNPKED